MNDPVKETTMETADLKALKKLALGRYLMLFLVLGACFFLPAWSLKYWEDWLYIVIVAVPAGSGVRSPHKES